MSSLDPSVWMSLGEDVEEKQEKSMDEEWTKMQRQIAARREFEDMELESLRKKAAKAKEDYDRLQQQIQLQEQERKRKEQKEAREQKQYALEEKERKRLALEEEKKEARRKREEQEDVGLGIQGSIMYLYDQYEQGLINEEELQNALSHVSVPFGMKR